MLNSFKSREARALFIVFSALFIIGGYTIFEGAPEDCNNKIKLAKYTYLLLSSSFAGAAFIAVMDYTISSFETSVDKKSLVGTSGWYFSLAMLTWALRGFAYYLAVKISNNFNYDFDLLDSIFSTFNSAFFILGMKDVYYSSKDRPKYLDRKVFGLLRNEKFVFTLAAIFILLEITTKLPHKIDLIFSTITVFYLFFTLKIAFQARGMPIFKYLVFSSLFFTLLVQIVLAFGVLEDSNTVSIGYFYTGSLEILLFGLLIGYYSYISLIRAKKASEREKKFAIQQQQQRGDMNHAIRNGLRDLRFDLSNGAMKSDNEIIQNVLHKIKVLEALHDHLFEQKQLLGIPFSDYLKEVIASFLKSRNLHKNQIKLEQRLPEEWATSKEETLRILARILTELNTNAFQAALKAGELSKIKIVNRLYVVSENLVIEVEDNGPGFDFAEIKARNGLGFGLKNVEELVIDKGGTITFSRLPKAGTLVKILIPTHKLLLVS